MRKLVALVLIIFFNISLAKEISSGVNGTTSPQNTRIILANLNRDLQEKATHKDIGFDHLPLANAIKEVRGDGSRSIAIFADIDCRYCKLLEKYELRKLDNVTIYTFLFAANGQDPTMKKSVESILCADNRLTAWQSYVQGNKPKPDASGCKAPESNVLLAQRLGVVATPTIILNDDSRLAGLIKGDVIDQRLNDIDFYGN